MVIVLEESIKPMIRRAIGVVFALLFVLGVLKWAPMLFRLFNDRNFNYDSWYIGLLLPLGFLCGIAGGAVAAIIEQCRGK